MDKPVSRGLQITFLAHALLSLVFGLALLLVSWSQPEPARLGAGMGAASG